MNVSGEKIIYLDAGSGISGDMFLGALSEIAGKTNPDFDLSRLCGKIAAPDFEVRSAKGERAGIAGTKVDVLTHDHHPHRGISHIFGILSESDISPEVRSAAEGAFTLLAEAEARVHGISPEEVHFHEVGAIDSIVDIVGAMLVMECLGWPAVMSSPVNVGAGTVRCAHGVLPVPAPATAELLRGLKIFSAGEPMERTTPTGALMLRALVGEDGFRPLPEGSIICTGTGLGGKDTPELPNVLRAMLLQTEKKPAPLMLRDEPSLLEANIDDMNPQDYGIAIERLFAAGALDVWCENILMKKGRPAVKLCCLAKKGSEDMCAEAMVRETSTIGVRIIGTRRVSLERHTEVRHTALGDVRFKEVRLGVETLRRAPEYEDMAEISRSKNLPMHEVRRVVSTDE
ncbi:MAG: nickel pincer cofactor biosynthesis protein LarC [Synergistaceae bacterium]|jgi:uncharacterized protein (TIGR00299 family) protein|nr:nickel pincer cofactor biosynthesis protein LarC [Synergistaceae bacterium]